MVKNKILVTQANKDNDGPLTKGDVLDIVQRVVGASEERMRIYIDKRITDNANHFHAMVTDGLDVLSEKIEKLTDRMDRHIGQTAIQINKFDGRVSDIEDFMQKLKQKTK